MQINTLLKFCVIYNLFNDCVAPFGFANHTPFISFFGILCLWLSSPSCRRFFSLPLSMIPAPGPTGRLLTDTNPAGSPDSIASHLNKKCHFFLMQGLASSARCVYLSSQHHYISFCRQDGHVDANGALLPADEWSLSPFATSLFDSLRHSSIKVYLIALRSLHIDSCNFHGRVQNGFMVHLPLKQLPFTIGILRVIHGSLDLNWVSFVSSGQANSQLLSHLTSVFNAQWVTCRPIHL